MRPLALAALAALAACAHRRTPAQDALLQRGDCLELLAASDQARAEGDHPSAKDLASGCPQDGLDKLLGAEKDPAKALLLCGRVRAAVGQGGKPLCSPARVVEWEEQLHPLLRIGPADETARADPLLMAALQELGPKVNLVYDPRDPQVIIGRMIVTFDHTTSRAMAQAPDPAGKTHQVPGVQHRLIAKAEAQVELAGRTRTLRANEQARDTTWNASPKFEVKAKPEPDVPSEAELRREAVANWVKALAKALASTPPESVDTVDLKSCLAYGIALAAATGNPNAGVDGVGDRGKTARCEQLLGMPPGGGIPTP